MHTRPPVTDRHYNNQRQPEYSMTPASVGGDIITKLILRFDQ